MKFKLALLAAALGIAAVAPAYADDDVQHHMVSGGWLYIDPQTSSTPLATNVYTPGGLINIHDQGTAASVSKESTLGLTYTYLVDDHWSMEFVGGVPPKFELSGSGQSQVLGDLGANKPLATVKQWSPTVLGIYTFLDHSYKLRPYVGLGLSYTKFTDVKLSPGFEQQVKARAAASGFGPVNVSPSADDNVAPVVTLGLNYEFAKNWYGVLSASYAPVETNANLSVTSAINGAQITSSSMHVKVDPVVTYLGVGYRF